VAVILDVFRGKKLRYDPEIMATVYGDSTPFPYEADFIERMRDAVECAVHLMAAQHVLHMVDETTQKAESLRSVERGKMDIVAMALERSVASASAETSARVRRAASRVIENARAVIDQEIADLDAFTQAELSKARSHAEKARNSADSALAKFLVQHVLPGSATTVKLVAAEKTYSAQASMVTPFGVEAEFTVTIPQGHEWSKLRKVGDINPGSEVHVPKSTGWISKRIEPRPVKLDKLVISELVACSTQTVLVLRTGARSGSGYQLEVTSHAAPRLIILGEDGSPTSDVPLELQGDDVIHATQLTQRVLTSTANLFDHRDAMKSAVADGRAIPEHPSPGSICERLIQVLAPVVTEIARRSGAPGELVLRKDLGGGRREEVYITKAELNEKVLSLPPALQSMFDPLELAEGPRSPRAPEIGSSMIKLAALQEASGDLRPIAPEPDAADTTIANPVRS
jgi:hypothetical protein